jgi:hypothetical protein
MPYQHFTSGKSTTIKGPTGATLTVSGTSREELLAHVATLQRIAERTARQIAAISAVIDGTSESNPRVIFNEPEHVRFHP